MGNIEDIARPWLHPCVSTRISAGGGYIFAASHTIQPEVPAENIRAMLDALCRHNGWKPFVF